MTTLAIIGGGIAGRSLIYTLAKEQKSLEKITIFHSDSFAPPCTIHSTAIVARRGVTAGHSELGDLLVKSYDEFKSHVELDHPRGVERITQYSGASEKVEMFKKRYPEALLKKDCGAFSLNHETTVAEEEGYLIDPASYTDWLLEEAKKKLGPKLEIINDFVLDVDGKNVKTQNGKSLSFDKIVFTTGSYSRFWKELAPQTKLESSRSVQGSYLEFNQVSLGKDSFSLTLDGDNLIWNAKLQRLLIGSTTHETPHLLAPVEELKAIYKALSEKVNLKIPVFENGIIRVGLREKAQKREPYLIGTRDHIFLGGLYKNGYSLSLTMSKTLAHQYL